MQQVFATPVNNRKEHRVKLKMKLKELIKKINEMCKVCNECEPCCTGNILKQYIKTKKTILKTA